MGFYLRKYVTVGPLRFNLSKSGVGVSAGVRGFRVSKGPRGNLVHMGREGIYYRPALPTKSSARSAASGSQPAPVTPLTPTPVDVDGEILFEDIDSADVSQMTDSSSADLLAEFDRKRKTVRYTPLVAVLGRRSVSCLTCVGRISVADWSRDRDAARGALARQESRRAGEDGRSVLSP